MASGRIAACDRKVSLARPRPSVITAITWEIRASTAWADAAPSCCRVREEPYVEARIMAGTRRRCCVRHILAEHDSALIVQGTFICANAILIEAILSFLGIRYSARDADRGQQHGRGARALSHSSHNIFFPHLPCADLLAVTC